ncbi:hypothetical protein JTB14_022036 [Gonioctena quinquepunctata]|nr:hypothetical protein JTB14_022036 [Gonioctena quinquepunctata]
MRSGGLEFTKSFPKLLTPNGFRFTQLVGQVYADSKIILTVDRRSHKRSLTFMSIVMKILEKSRCDLKLEECHHSGCTEMNERRHLTLAKLDTANECYIKNYKLFVNGKAYEAADLIQIDRDLEIKSTTKPNSYPATPKSTQGENKVQPIPTNRKSETDKTILNSTSEGNNSKTQNKPITRQQVLNDPPNRRKLSTKS